MTNAPERIYATCTGGRHWVEIRVGEYQEQYIRADVIEKQTEQLTQLLEDGNRAWKAQIAERDARIAELEALVLELVDKLENAELESYHEYVGDIQAAWVSLHAEMEEYRRRVTPQTEEEA